MANKERAVTTPPAVATAAPVYPPAQFACRVCWRKFRRLDALLRHWKACRGHK